jgi:hypothetical protein
LRQIQPVAGSAGFRVLGTTLVDVVAGLTAAKGFKCIVDQSPRG